MAQRPSKCPLSHFTPGGKSPRYPLDRRLGGPQSWNYENLCRRRAAPSINRFCGQRTCKRLSCEFVSTNAVRTLHYLNFMHRHTQRDVNVWATVWGGSIILHAEQLLICFTRHSLLGRYIHHVREDKCIQTGGRRTKRKETTWNM
jgi:hypothetical protein